MSNIKYENFTKEARDLAFNEAKKSMKPLRELYVQFQENLPKEMKGVPLDLFQGAIYKRVSQEKLRQRLKDVANSTGLVDDLIDLYIKKNWEGKKTLANLKKRYPGLANAYKEKSIYTLLESLRDLGYIIPKKSELNMRGTRTKKNKNKRTFWYNLVEALIEEHKLEHVRNFICMWYYDRDVPAASWTIGGRLGITTTTKRRIQTSRQLVFLALRP